MSRDIVPLGLRMPPEVKEQIEAAAKANGRSMNAEIVARLQASFSETEFSQAINTDVLNYAHANNLTVREALNALVAAALMSPPIYYVSIEKDASFKDVSTALRQLRAIAPDDASLLAERK